MRALLLLVALLAPGCFLDELDSAMAELERQSPSQAEPARPDSEAGAESEGAGGPGLLARVRGWWEERWQEPEPPRDTSPIVLCDLDGRMRFMRRSECITRGGRDGG